MSRPVVGVCYKTLKMYLIRLFGNALLMVVNGWLFILVLSPAICIVIMFKLIRGNFIGKNVRGLESLDTRDSAAVDGVLYFVDPKEPGVMFGIDVENYSSSMVPTSVALKCNPKDDSSSSMVPTSVALKCNPKDYEWIPQPCPLRKFYRPLQPHFLSVGKGKLAAERKLAAVHSFSRPNNGHLHVFCSTIKMSKLKDKDGRYQFVANRLRVSDVILGGMHIEDCIAVFPSQTRGSREDVSKGDNVVLAPEDDRKEDNTVSAEEDVSMEDIQFQLERMVSMGEKTISAPEDGSSDINKKRRKLAENVDFPSRTRGPQDGVSKGDNAISAPKDVRKEDNTISAEEDNTIAAEEDVDQRGGEYNFSSIGWRQRHQ